MRRRTLLATAATAASAFAGIGAARAAEVVTVYSADGLKDGARSWYGDQFAAFTKATGIQVQYVEAGSGVVVARVEKEKSNAQADVLVTLPPFIMKAAEDGMLEPYASPEAAQVPAASKDAQHRYVAIVNNYMCFIYDGAMLPQPPKSFTDLLQPQFKNRLQYSTPGQAGDGTAVMLQVNHAFGSKQAGFAFLKQLQANNRGPSSSTGRLTALVNKGELLVSNGDVQMNAAQMADNPNIRIFFPAGPDGKRSTFALPYYAGLVKGAPHAANGRKLIDFLLSRAAQESVTAVAKGLPVRSDVHPTDAAYKMLSQTMQGVEIWSPDWSAVARDLQADVASWHAATGS